MLRCHFELPVVAIALLLPHTAKAQQAVPQQLVDSVSTLLQLGGPVVAILLLMSVAGLAIVLFKVWQFLPFSGASFDRIGRMLDECGGGDSAELLQRLKSEKNETAGLLASGVVWLSDSTVSEDLIREELIRQGNAIIARLNSLLRLLEQIAYLAPLLGLLGTVLGIIGVFQGLAASGGGAGSTGAMAGGIWEALLTTALGLSVAIPFALVNAALDNRVSHIQGHIQDQLSRLFTAPLSANVAT